MSPKIHPDLEEKFRLLGSLREFTQIFYKLRTGRKFALSDPIGRESHYITVWRELVKVFKLESKRLIINLPPGHGKSTILQHFVAWAMAHYPDSNFLYISYSKSLAEKHTAAIKEIMELPHYRKLFGVELSQDTTAKALFKTTKGGTVGAYGSSGAITGQDAGLPNLDRFSGCVIIDDAHKPDEVTSDTIRESVIENYKQTIKPRPRGENVPIVFLGQRLHEQDLAAFLIDGKDGNEWRRVILKAIDDAGNALCPNINSIQMLRTEAEFNPYVFSSQYQQDPQPSGGGIFKPEWFTTYDYEPEILATFITADTAETDKSYNDATVFSFWGIYKIKQFGADTDIFGLHWIDCREIRVEPKDLQSEFADFYRQCMQHKVKPKLIAIEKKSTGVTLLSVLKDMQGVKVLDIDRNVKAGSKTQRFLNIQPYVAEKRVSLPTYAAHTKLCVEHCRKITANNTHAHDDIADTLHDAVKIALIDKVIQYQVQPAHESSKLGKVMSRKLTELKRLKSSAYS